MVGDSFGQDTVHCLMKTFNLGCRRLIGRRTKFFDSEQLANLSHYAAVYFFSLITKDRQRTAKASEDLFYQDFGNGFGFFVFDSERFGSLSITVHTCQNPEVSTI